MPNKHYEFKITKIIIKLVSRKRRMERKQLYLPLNKKEANRITNFPINDRVVILEPSASYKISRTPTKNRNPLQNNSIGPSNPIAA